MQAQSTLSDCQEDKKIILQHLLNVFAQCNALKHDKRELVLKHLLPLEDLTVILPINRTFESIKS